MKYVSRLGKISCRIGLSLCLAGIVWGGLGARADEPAVISLGEGGVILRDGQPYRGVGINYFNAFSRMLDDPEDTSSLEGIKTLARYKVPFARVQFAGYYPKDWKIYQEDKELWFELMDKLVRTAEEAGVGLIPSVFFAYTYVPDLIGEPRSAWGDTSSKTHAFMRQYVEEVVTRYRDSKAIWAWEFSNEFNLDVDLPNAAQHRPPILPHWGTPTERSEADDLTYDMMMTAFRAFGEEVRKHDPVRLITHGASLPRPAAEHLRTEGRWVHDTPEQFRQNLIATSPDPLDLVSIHMYPFDHERFGRKDVPYAELLRHCMEACAEAGKALFLGEFGSSDDMEGGPEKAKAEFYDQLAAIEETGVPLSALWVFDLENQTGTCNIRPDNSRSYQLEALTEVNARLQAKED